MAERVGTRHVLVGMRDEERARRNQSGVLLGVGVGTVVCAGVWLAGVALERATGGPLRGIRRRLRAGSASWRCCWQQGGVRGMRIAPLIDDYYRLMLVSWSPNTNVPYHDHPRGEEIFVLKGELQDQRGRYPAGTWQRLHPGTGHSPHVTADTLILLRNGHLRK